MRPIKFRVWDKSLEEMRYSINIPSDYTERNGSLDLINMFQTLNQRYVFMQYTGLKDKNGREIYEGDIFRDNDCFLWEVYWEDGSFWAKGGEYDVSEHLIEFVPDWCEVVGNIYEHTHLLEVQHD